MVVQVETTNPGRNLLHLYNSDPTKSMRIQREFRNLDKDLKSTDPRVQKEALDNFCLFPKSFMSGDDAAAIRKFVVAYQIKESKKEKNVNVNIILKLHDKLQTNTFKNADQAAEKKLKKAEAKANEERLKTSVLQNIEPPKAEIQPVVQEQPKEETTSTAQEQPKEQTIAPTVQTQPKEQVQPSTPAVQPAFVPVQPESSPKAIDANDANLIANAILGSAPKSDAPKQQEPVAPQTITTPVLTPPLSTPPQNPDDDLQKAIEASLKDQKPVVPSQPQSVQREELDVIPTEILTSPEIIVENTQKKSLKERIFSVLTAPFRLLASIATWFVNLFKKNNTSRVES